MLKTLSRVFLITFTRIFQTLSSDYKKAFNTALDAALKDPEDESADLYKQAQAQFDGTISINHSINYEVTTLIHIVAIKLKLILCIS